MKRELDYLHVVFNPHSFYYGIMKWGTQQHPVDTQLLEHYRRINACNLISVPMDNLCTKKLEFLDYGLPWVSVGKIFTF